MSLDLLVDKITLGLFNHYVSTFMDLHRNVIYEQPLMLAVKLQDNYYSCEKIKTENLSFYQSISRW